LRCPYITLDYFSSPSWVLHAHTLPQYIRSIYVEIFQCDHLSLCCKYTTLEVFLFSLMRAACLHAPTMYKIHLRQDLPRRSFILVFSMHKIGCISLLPHACCMPNESLNQKSFISRLSVIYLSAEGPAALYLQGTRSQAVRSTSLRILYRSLSCRKSRVTLK
jgi:hypothetical protein